MKTSIPLLLFLLLVATILAAFGDPVIKKKISDSQFRYEFFTVNESINVKSNREYYWFKGGAIHTSENGMAGELLNGQYEKFYLNNQLAEKGVFDRGLKTGYWKTWYKNGRIATEQYWDAGQKDGSYFFFSEEGNVVERGRFKANRKDGRWINYISKDTIQYKNDSIFIKKPPKRFLLFGRPALTKDERAVRKVERKQKVKNSPQQKGKKPSEKKEGGFFKRLFSKNDSKQKSDAKGQ